MPFISLDFCHTIASLGKRRPRHRHTPANAGVLEMGETLRTAPKIRVTERQFIAYFHFVGWDCVQLGIHLCVSSPNVEIHLPFGFVRIGWAVLEYFTPKELRALKAMPIRRRTFGIVERWFQHRWPQRSVEEN